MAHEEAHIEALGTRLQAHGGPVPAAPASVATANRYLAHRKSAAGSASWAAPMRCVCC